MRTHDNLLQRGTALAERLDHLHRVHEGAIERDRYLNRHGETFATERAIAYRERVGDDLIAEANAVGAEAMNLSQEIRPGRHHSALSEELFNVGQRLINAAARAKAEF